jgi:AcrR family transcriptional regulator
MAQHLKKPPTALQAGETDPKIQLLLAAETLFAARGIQGVSLREIATAAGHGNNNAVRYHFGSMHGLIQAIFRYRVAQMEPPRAGMLAVAERDGMLQDLRTLLDVFYLPHLDLRDATGRYPYSAFLAHYLLYLRPRGMQHVADNAGTVSASLLRAQQLLRARLAYLPDKVFDARLRVASVTFYTTLLIHDQATEPDDSGLTALVEDTLEQMTVAIGAAWRPHRALRPAAGAKVP